uniref:Uncharacterized protein n=1 Tax=Rhodosorus marinus TaxID=101924 RepID=A0A7S2ZJC1_9RHOD|mmetsp:Transcript_19204/g.76956  ORF Transcript_19204/g.76956 Transcript_19204/m.76956 type:complete len:263 (+) Transcript_19204:529-1317(+)|eukprot:CAMPEP_0113967942 /NCGR_PEP_ID=MMETSP0011_2-20120614/9228_1 /TAXON_ID=101924 /ORGANISM="Rhodosorus marinus" /LENGTH=262 /DNA_ID=CAMNT_0000980917 /DNA_START=378 /DNA_END=1166 /DNA_ORIENTATION=- /assembly_acc=CAM_ASM_000156
MGVGDFLLGKASRGAPKSKGVVGGRLEAVDSENGNPMEMLENMGVKTQQLANGRDFSEAVEYVHEENMQVTARELWSVVYPQSYASNGRPSSNESFYRVEDSETTVSVVEEEYYVLESPTEEVSGKFLSTPLTPTEESSCAAGDWDNMENEKESKNKWCSFSVNESGCKEVDPGLLLVSELPGKDSERRRGIPKSSSRSIAEFVSDTFADLHPGIIKGSRRRISKLASRAFTDLHPGREGVTAAGHVDAEFREMPSATASGI